MTPLYTKACRLGGRCAAVLAVFLTGLGASGFVAGSSAAEQTVTDRHGPPEAAHDLNQKVSRSPKEFRKGTATLAQIKDWIARNLPGQPRWFTSERDLDQDGIPDLLIADDRNSGTGGHAFEAFLRTPEGFRYIGEFSEPYRTLPPVAGHLRFVIAGHISAGEIGVALVELRPDGLHRLASAAVAAGDQGTAEGNRLADELLRAPTVSMKTLRLLFGAMADPMSQDTYGPEK